MAEQTSRDVVEQAQSVGDLSPSDVPATTIKTHAATEGDGGVGSSLGENGVSKPSILQPQPSGESNNTEVSGELLNGTNNRPGRALNRDDTTLATEVALSNPVSREGSQGRNENILEDGTARSDTDGSRGEGSVTGDGKNPELSKPVKRFSTAKPVSFAKYSVPGKTIAANGPVKSVPEKAIATTTSSNTPVQQAGRPRLVAKTTISLQQKAKPYKSTTPDPMQVWNKNRVMPQPSTKHLTDEELKQQYGIHMTSRMQDDGEGKEAKWADIDDDDEEDWAPTTIEWNDGTKSTVAPAEVAPTIEKKIKADAEAGGDRSKPLQPSKILTSQFTSSVGPNATVLKLGASAGRQQTQKPSAQQSSGTADKQLQSGSKSALAVPPTKSPWAALPPVDKVSPIAINPQMAMPPPPQRLPSGNVYSASPAAMTAPSPAQEISADDFSRSWRESSASQSRELYMPNSGKYEAVPEGRRRMSKNELNFRKPAVLQRPGYGDPHAPAEPSAAFQTSRTSIDQVRRRASSSISGGSGPFARRMSVTRSSEAAPVFADTPQTHRDSIRPDSQEGPPSQLETPTYQARGGPGASYFPTGVEQPQPPQDLEAERAQQKLAMREKVEQARKRKQEEEARLEAEKQERIRLKLASLAPLAQSEKTRTNETSAEPISDPQPVVSSTAQSPPKPPQPLATGEPQQYGMMKVHPLDSIKKPPFSNPQQANNIDQTWHNDVLQPLPEQAQSDIPTVNGVRPVSDSQQRPGQQDNISLVDRSPRPPKAMSVGPEARAGWNDVRNDHRTPPSANLWGLPNTKALGNGTFDQTLASFPSQDLSTGSGSYAAQGWMNGRTPIQERSPHLQYANNLVPEGRSPLLATIPADEQSLAANSEADSLLPISKPVPIGPPQPQIGGRSWQSSPSMPHAGNGVAAWNNFHAQAAPQERADTERVQHELAIRREEEMRTGIRSGSQYTFSETWKQVQVGDQAGQRQVSSVAQTTIPATNMFGAVGSTSGPDATPRNGNGSLGARPSRFFPQPAEGTPIQTQRAVTHSGLPTRGSPSPPPAEEYASLHPAFDGDCSHPIVHFPREKAVVKLPPAKPPSPPAPESSTPLSWAARAAQPAPQPSLRAVSTPIAQTPSWQARFDGLLRKASPTKQSALPAEAAFAVTSSSREPWDVLPAPLSAAVSLPQQEDSIELTEDAGKITSKDVEDEEDLFEDREAGSLPIVRTPREGLPVFRFRGIHPPALPVPSPVDSASIRSFMVPNTLRKSDDYRPPTTRIYLPGMTRPVIKTLAKQEGSVTSGSVKGRNSSAAAFGNKNARIKGSKSRQASEAHHQTHQVGPKSQQASGTHPHSQTQSQHSGPSTQPASPMHSGNNHSRASTPPASQVNGHTRGLRNTTHAHRGWKGKQPHPQPQAQTAH